MKIALAQINTLVGDLRGNARKIIDYTNELNGQVDLILFPELSLMGYPPKDLLLRKDFVDESLEILGQEIIPQITTPTLLGIISKSLNTQRLHNSVALIQNGRIQQVFHKKLLPDYEVFNESRYFQPGLTKSLEDFVFELNGKKVGVLICEDLLGAEINFSHYGINPLEFISKRIDLDLAVCLSASPFRQDKIPKRIQLTRLAQEKLKCPIALVNQVGANDDLIFDGSSFVLNNNNEVISQARSFEEEILICEISQQIPSPPSRSQNFPMMEKKIENNEIIQALVLGIKDYFHKTGFKKAFIGISGGVDSALVSALTVEALGKDNVIGIMMPSIYSSAGSLGDGQELINNLGIKTQTISIQAILESYLEGNIVQKLTLAEENLQARIRGNILMSLAGQEGGLVLATGNKSEFAVGYSTLYGDMCGALAPIGDLWKTQVWDLAKLFSTIPKQIIEKPPSAELRPNQLDIDSLPDYVLLDAILKDYIENGLNIEEIEKKGFDKHLIEKTLLMLHRTEFKRKQAPIILKISNVAFGSGWIQAIAKK